MWPSDSFSLSVLIALSRGKGNNEGKALRLEDCKRAGHRNSAYVEEHLGSDQMQTATKCVYRKLRQQHTTNYYYLVALRQFSLTDCPPQKTPPRQRFSS